VDLASIETENLRQPVQYSNTQASAVCTPAMSSVKHVVRVYTFILQPAKAVTTTHSVLIESAHLDNKHRLCHQGDSATTPGDTRCTHNVFTRLWL